MWGSDAGVHKLAMLALLAMLAILALLAFLALLRDEGNRHKVDCVMTVSRL